MIKIHALNNLGNSYCGISFPNRIVHKKRIIKELDSVTCLKCIEKIRKFN